MQPHEWANQITRSVDADLRVVDEITSSFQTIKHLAGELRHHSFLDDATDRKVDYISVKLESTSRELERLRSEVQDHHLTMRAALMGG